MQYSPRIFPKKVMLKAEISYSFEIEAKIHHNAIRRNRDIIEEYGPYHARLKIIYDELEGGGKSFRKETLLGTVRNVYLTVKREFVKNAADNNQREIEIVQKHADDIFEEVENRLLESVNDLTLVEYGHAISIIMVDAFTRCEILEK